ncbi:hypothetical protein CF326_g333 [Tilletia indica]|nr:hypothetical protein CF326_g333 [Tilletia indica]
MVQLKPTFSLLSAALLLTVSLSDVGAAPMKTRLRPFQGNAVTPGKGVAAPQGPNQLNGQPFPVVQPLVNVQSTGNNIARRQQFEDPSTSSYASDATTDDSSAVSAADESAYATDSTQVEPASFAADVAQSPQSQGQALNWFMADTDTDSPELNMAGPGGPDDDGLSSYDGSQQDVPVPNQYAVKAPSAGGMKPTEADATGPAWRAVPCNGEMFEGAGQTNSDANQYVVVPLAQPSVGAQVDDGQYHPGQLSASPSTVSTSKRSIYHRLGDDKKSHKKGGKSGSKKGGKKHKKGKKSRKTRKSRKNKKGKKALKHKKHAGASASKKTVKRSAVNDQVLKVEGSGINIHLVGGDLDPSIYRHDDLIRLRTRDSHGHSHIHDHGDYYDDDRYSHHSQHWREHHGYYRHGGDHVHEHVHVHKRDLFAPGTRGTVAVLQPLVGSLLDTGLAQQVATLVLAPLNNDATAPVTGLLKNGLNLATDVSPSASDASNAANAFLLSPSSTQPGTKLMLVDSPNQGMIKPSNMSDWRQVQLQATVFNLATATDPAATTAAAATGTGAGAASDAVSAASSATGSGTGSAATASGQFCATIDTRPPSTLRMELCDQVIPGTSQEFLYDPSTGQLTPFVDGSSTTSSASIQGKRQTTGPGAAAVAPSASASASSVAPAPASVKLVFIADAPAAADVPPPVADDVDAAADATTTAAASAASSAAPIDPSSVVDKAVSAASTAAYPQAQTYAVSQQQYSSMDGTDAADDTASDATSDASSGYSSAASSSSTDAAVDDASDAGYGSTAGAGRRAFAAVRRFFASGSVGREV